MRKRRLAFWSVVFAAFAQGALALELTLPGTARLTFEDRPGLEGYALPIAPYDGSQIPARIFEGLMSKQSWRIEGAGVTPLQLMRPLRAELETAGYRTIFECPDDQCGGFDFRFGTEVIGAPDMVVDLDDYRFLSALKGPPDAPVAAVSLLISRSAIASFVQIIQIAVQGEGALSVAVQGSSPQGTAQEAEPNNLGFEELLDLNGHVALTDLVFKTGSSELGEGPFESLQSLADYLERHPSWKVALVGHSDAVGNLDGNITLSRRRAQSVMQRLIKAYAVSEERVQAQGVGFLAPVASNLTEAGREANRRVEAVLISTE